MVHIGIKEAVDEEGLVVKEDMMVSGMKVHSDTNASPPISAVHLSSGHVLS